MYKNRTFFSQAGSNFQNKKNRSIKREFSSTLIVVTGLPRCQNCLDDNKCVQYFHFSRARKREVRRKIIGKSYY